MKRRLNFLRHIMLPTIYLIILSVVPDLSQSVQFPALSQGQADCDVVNIVGSFCRVKRFPSVAVLQARLKIGKTSWSEQGEAVFAFQGAADSVSLYLSGGAWKMARVAGTDIWAIVLKIPDSERTVLGYQFMIIEGENIQVKPKLPVAWRGTSAPPAPRRNAVLRGRMTEETIQSVNLGANRQITIYAPPLRPGEKIAATVYLADGGQVHEVAPYVDYLVASRRLPAILLVGVHPGKNLPGGDPQTSDTRALEYLIGFGKTDERFEAHEQFFINEVMPWAETKFNAPKDRGRRAVWGASNSGSFALAMGLRHSDAFGHIIAFSPTWSGNLSAPKWTRVNAPSHYLLFGTLESKNVRKLASDWSETISQNGAAVTLRQPVSGHDGVMWREWFGDALVNEFGKLKPRSRRAKDNHRRRETKKPKKSA